jgi:hypothetical protein
VFTLAQNLEVRLNEAKPVTGGLLFQIMQGVPNRPDSRPHSFKTSQPTAPKSKPGGRKRKW